MSVPTDQRRPTTVLVCDDDEDIRALLATVIGTLADRVQQAADGRAALASIAEQPPDLVLLDRNLPGGLDGLEVVRRVRALPGPGPLVLMLSAQREPEDVDEAREAGVDDFLGKPFRVPELVARVRAVLDRGRDEG